MKLQSTVGELVHYQQLYGGVNYMFLVTICSLTQQVGRVTESKRAKADLKGALKMCELKLDFM